MTITGQAGREHQPLRKSLQGLAIGAAAALVVSLLYRAGVLESLELRTLDGRFRMLPAWTATNSPAGVAVVEIDQGSIETVDRTMNYRWPWPRLFYGRIVDYLAACGARAVVFDMFFTEPDIDRDFPGRESDAAFEEATARGGRAYHACVLQAQQGPPPPADRNAAWMARRAEARIDAGRATDLPDYASAMLPSAALAAGSRALGFVNVATEADNVTRRVPLLARHRGAPLLSLSGAAAWDLAGRPAVRAEARALWLGARRLPMDPSGQTWLWWYRQPRGGLSVFPRYPAWALLRARAEQEAGRPPSLPPAAFSNKVVFIGSTATGLFDVKATPLATGVPGVFIQATALANLLRGDAVARLPPGPVLALTAALCLLVGVAARGIRQAGPGIATVAVGLAAVWLAGYLLLLKRHLFLDIVPLYAGGLLTFLAVTTANYLSERRHSRLVRNIFEHYLDRAVVRTLISHPDQVRLGGERRACTVLFSDVANFTHTSESMAPEKVVQFMNVYLDAMTDIILREGGFVDKYVGDEIVAIFGAPHDAPDHARRACRAIVRMQQRVRELKPAFAELGCAAEIFARSGLSTGEVVVGNMGSEKRMNYTAMGDVMNLGARLEGANKMYGTRVLVSDPTAEAARGAFVFREIDRVRVKGKDTAVRIHELVGPREALAPDAERRLAAFAEALDLYRRQRWTDALRRFDPLAQEGDEPSAVFAARCRAYADAPPPADWDGSYTLTAK